MIKTEEKNIVNQISLTGVRAITLLGLLIIAPRSMDEIRNAFLNIGLIDDKKSDDILRIDLNTLKAVGCEVSRSSSKTNYKYVLTKHPFVIPLTIDDIVILKQIYNKLVSYEKIEQLLNFDTLFKSISKYIYDETIKETLLGISVFKHYKTEQIIQLLKDSKDKNLLELLYKKSSSATEDKKTIILNELVLKNGKIYLYCYDIDKKKFIILNLMRVTKILSRKTCQINVVPKDFKVKFKINNEILTELNENEVVIDNQKEYSLVCGNYYNEFIAMQRILSFGINCVITEPKNFKGDIVAKLQKMKGIYE